MKTPLEQPRDEQHGPRPRRLAQPIDSHFELARRALRRLRFARRAVTPLALQQSSTSERAGPSVTRHHRFCGVRATNLRTTTRTSASRQSGVNLSNFGVARAVTFWWQKLPCAHVSRRDRMVSYATTLLMATMRQCATQIRLAFGRRCCVK